MATPNWWQKMTPAAQKAYLARHPNSVYGRAGGRRSLANAVKTSGTPGARAGGRRAAAKAIMEGKPLTSKWVDKTMSYLADSKPSAAKAPPRPAVKTGGRAAGGGMRSRGTKASRQRRPSRRNPR